MRFPCILGIECVGVVAESSDPARLRPGIKVASLMGEMGRAFDGGYAEYTLLPNEQIYPIETELPWEMAAAVPETFHTAFLFLRNLRIGPGMKVVVRGATSGVGVAFLRLLKAGFPDVRAVGTTRNTDKGHRLLDAGFDDVVLDDGGALATEEKFDRAFELIGPATMRDTCAHMVEGGIVCSTGQLGGQWYLDGFDPIVDLPPNGYPTSAYSDNVSANAVQRLFSYVESKGVGVAPERVFRLDQVSDAHEYLASAHSFGKVVVLNDVALGN